MLAKKYFHFLVILILCSVGIHSQEKTHIEQNSVLLKRIIFDSTSQKNTIFSLYKEFYKITNESFTKIDSILTYGTDGARSKITYIYNLDGTIASFTIFSLHEGSWQFSRKVSNIYDTKGKLISTLHEVWDGYNWINRIFNEFFYDSVGNNNLEIIQEWIDNRWLNSNRISNFYSPTKILICSKEEIWQDSIWLNLSKITHTYLKNGMRMDDTFQVWQNNNWINSIFTQFDYVDDTVLYQILNLEWKNGSWNNYVRTTFTYNSFEPQTVGLIEAWFENKWEYYDRYLYSYNSNGYFTNGEYEYWINNQWISGNGNIHVSNPNGFDLHFYTHMLSIYYTPPTAVKENFDFLPKYELHQNHPNPFNPITTILYDVKDKGLVVLSVYDILGKEVAKLVNESKDVGSYSINFDASNLPSGVYIYTLRANDFSASKKMIVIK